MPNLYVKINTIGTIFMIGAKAQLKHEWVWGASLYIGLNQGLKYKGDLKNGIKGGVATLAAISAVSGVYNIVLNWDSIKRGNING